MKVIYKTEDEEINSVGFDLKNRDFNEALKKTKILSKKYSEDYRVLKLFSIIYFKMMEWEKAIKYFKKIKSHMGNKNFLSFQRLGMYGLCSKKIEPVTVWNGGLCIVGFPIK